MKKRKPQVLLTYLRTDEETETTRRPLELSLFRRMFRYTGPYKKNMVWLTVTALLRSMQLPALVAAMSAIIQGPIRRGDTDMLWLAVAGYALLALFTYITFYFRMYNAQLVGEGIVHDLRNEIFSKLQTLTMSFFNKTKVGRIFSRMISDAEAVRTGVADAVFVGVVNIGVILFASAIMLWIDPKLFLVVLVMSPVYLLIYKIFRWRLSSARRDAQESMSRVTANLAESVVGIRVTQGFVRQDVNAQVFGDLVADHALYNIASSRAAGRFNPLIEFLGQFLIGMIFIVFALLYLDPPLAAGFGIITYFYYQATSFLAPVSQLGNQYSNATIAMAGAERVFGLLDRQPDFVDEPDAADLPPIQGRVEFRGLTFAYEPGKPVLHDVNFVAEPGRTIALVGHTGSGKTSIINLISKFYLPTSGQVLIDGREVRKIKTDALHRQMGIVLQANFLFTGTVMDNIRIGRMGAADEEVIEAAKRLDTLDLFAALPQGFQTQVGERGGALSLGQRQLVCFTRAMLADPRIIILDEATSAVDTMTEVRVQRSLAILLRGRTSFVVAHRLSTIRHADVVLVLDQGRIVERGTHVELLATGGVYANLYQQFIQASGAR